MVLFLVQDPSHWDVVEPLPSYGRGLEVPGGRYQSLINGYMLHDVVITGFFHLPSFCVFPASLSCVCFLIELSCLCVIH